MYKQRSKMTKFIDFVNFKFRRGQNSLSFWHSYSESVSLFSKIFNFLLINFCPIGPMGKAMPAVPFHFISWDISHGNPIPMDKPAVNSSQILKRCHTEYETKIQTALLIKKLNSNLNKQFYAKGASFLLSIFLFVNFSVTS